MLTPDKKYELLKAKESVAADQEVLRIISEVSRESSHEACYKLLLSSIAKRYDGDARLTFYFELDIVRKVIDYLIELGEADLIHVERGEDARNQFLRINRITYKGRMELARLEREEAERLAEERRKVEQERLRFEIERARKWRWCVRLLWILLGTLVSTLIATVLPRLANKFLDRWLSPEVHQVEVVNLPADGVDAPGK